MDCTPPTLVICNCHVVIMFLGVSEDDDPPAEVEVLVDLEDFTAVRNAKSKNKNPKKV